MIHQNSRESFEEHKKIGKRESYRKRIWDLYLKEWPRPLTDREVMLRLETADPNNIRPEITRLIQDGLLVETDRVKCPITHKTVRAVSRTVKPYFSRDQKTKEAHKEEQGVLF